jgi:phage repressor protein C with HTH and peptisase S24 domain
MNNKLTSDRLAKATASVTDKLRWAETCLRSASDTRQKAAKEAINVYETYLAALEFVREAKDGFVLRPDRDPAAMAAMKEYAKTTENRQLAEDIWKRLREKEK